MKSDTWNSIKFLDTQEELGLTRWQLVGVLESIWKLTEKQAPQGNIGKYSNRQICRSIGWEDDPDQLINGLVCTGWLDTCRKHRLLIHDWADHAPNWLHATLARKGLSFLSPVSDATEKPLRKTSVTPEKVAPDTDTEEPDGFNDFWERWPKGGRKSGRAKCRAFWHKQKLHRHTPDILDGLSRWLTSAEWAKENGQYIPAPIVWLRDARWEADPPQAQTVPEHPLLRKSL